MPSFDQAGDGSTTASITYFDLKNNDDGVTYDRGELKYNELLTSVAESVKVNNSSYSSSSIENIMSEWDVQTRGPPAGEIESGWSTSLSSRTLDLTHSGLGYTRWLDTNTESDQDEVLLGINFYDQLDFNHNGLIDDNERLTQTSTYVDKAFRGYAASGTDFNSGTNAIGVVPEPTALSLIGVIGAGLIAARRIFGMDYKR